MTTKLKLDLKNLSFIDPIVSNPEMKYSPVGTNYIATIIYNVPKRQASMRNKKEQKEQKLKTLPYPQVPWKYIYFTTFIDHKRRNTLKEAKEDY